MDKKTSFIDWLVSRLSIFRKIKTQRQEMDNLIYELDPAEKIRAQQAEEKKG